MKRSSYRGGGQDYPKTGGNLGSARFGMKIELVKGDIAKEEVDVIVNAAGTNLFMGGGVAGALKKVGGKEIEEEALKYAPAKLSEVIVTNAGKLNAKYVFHAAAQPHYWDFKASEESVKNAVKNVLEKAEELGCGSIALPALGCGIAGLDIRKGARAIIGELKNYKGKKVNVVRVVLFSEENFEVFKKEFECIAKQCNDYRWNEVSEDSQRTAGFPARDECLKLLRKHNTERVVKHSLLVNKVAVFLAEKLKEKGIEVNVGLVDRASLLHDLDKIESLRKGKHGKIGEEKLKGKGWHSIAVIVRKHVLNEILQGLESWEEKVVYYADKRVRHNEIVSLKERLDYIQERYCCVNKELCEKIHKIEEKAFALEKEILEKAGVSEKLEGIEDA